MRGDEVNNSESSSEVTPDDKGQILRKQILLFGVVATLAVVMLLLAACTNDPNELARAYIDGNIDKMGEQTAGFVAGDNWLLKELGGEWVEDRIHDTIEWSYVDAQPIGDDLYLVVATASGSVAVDYERFRKTYSVEASLPFNLEVNTNSGTVRSEPDYASGRVTHDIPAAPEFLGTEEAIEKVDAAKDKAKDLLRKIGN